MKNDIITWLIDGAIYAGKSLTVADISSRVLLVCFTSIHTTSAVRVPSLLTHLFGFDLFIMQVYTATLYQLCLSAQDVATLREEVQGVVEEEGWTRLALSKMHKLDSYLREVLRVHTIATRE